MEEILKDNYQQCKQKILVKLFWIKIQKNKMIRKLILINIPLKRQMYKIIYNQYKANINKLKKVSNNCRSFSKKN